MSTEFVKFDSIFTVLHAMQGGISREKNVCPYQLRPYQYRVIGSVTDLSNSLRKNVRDVTVKISCVFRTAEAAAADRRSICRVVVKAELSTQMAVAGRPTMTQNQRHLHSEFAVRARHV